MPGPIKEVAAESKEIQCDTITDIRAYTLDHCKRSVGLLKEMQWLDPRLTDLDKKVCAILNDQVSTIATLRIAQN